MDSVTGSPKATAIDGSVQYGSRRAAALHEAGHVVSHAVHGIHVKSVRLNRTLMGWEGWTATERQPDCHPASALADDIAVGAGHFAGHLAERMFVAAMPGHANQDELLAASMVVAIMREKGCTMDVEAHTSALLERNRSVLVLIADSLMRERRLFGNRLRHLTREVTR